MKVRRNFLMITGCFVVLFASCAILAVAATSAGRKEAEKLYEKGNKLVEQGKYREAEQSYEKALELVSDFAPLYYNLAQAQNELGEYEKALKNYREYIRLRPRGETSNQAMDSIRKIELKLREQSPGATSPMEQVPAAPAVQPSGRQMWLEPVTGLEFEWLPGGCFQMGSPQGEQGSSDNERPVHEACVGGFWMGKTDVTVRAFRQFVDSTGYLTDAEKAGWAMALVNGKWKRGTGLNWRNTGMGQNEMHPVIDVSWNDAKAMAQWLSRQGKGTFDLPSEAEWEYGCRSGTRTARFWGDSPDQACAYGNVRDETARKKFPAWEDVHACEDGYVFTSPVGTFRPNGFGLDEMLGNVRNWCNDTFEDGAYLNPGRGRQADSGAGGDHVVRGAGWFNVPGDVRCGKRAGFDASNYSFDLGFRLIRRSAGPSPGTETNQLAAQGKEIFNRNCSRCHPGGDAGIGPSLKKTNLQDFNIKFKARHSSGTMPRFSKMQLNDEQLDAVAAYIRSLQNPTTATSMPPPRESAGFAEPLPRASGPGPSVGGEVNQAVAAGREIFNRNCSRCHPGGEAGIGPSLRKMNLRDFNIKFKARHSSGTMPQFSKTLLTDEQLDNVVAYIRSLKDR